MNKILSIYKKIDSSYKDLERNEKDERIKNIYNKIYSEEFSFIKSLAWIYFSYNLVFMNKLSSIIILIFISEIYEDLRRIFSNSYIPNKFEEAAITVSWALLSNYIFSNNIQLIPLVVGFLIGYMYILILRKLSVKI